MASTGYTLMAARVAAVDMQFGEQVPSVKLAAWFSICSGAQRLEGANSDLADILRGYATRRLPERDTVIGWLRACKANWNGKTLDALYAVDLLWSAGMLAPFAVMPGPATKVEPEHVAAPLVRAEYPGEYPKRRRLPAAVCSDEAEHLAGSKRERDTLDRHAARVPLPDALESDEEFRGTRRRYAVTGRASGHGGSRSPRTCTSSPPLPARPRSRRAQGSAGVRRGQARWPRSPCCRDGPR